MSTGLGVDEAGSTGLVVNEAGLTGLGVNEGGMTGRVVNEAVPTGPRFLAGNLGTFLINGMIVDEASLTGLFGVSVGCSELGGTGAQVTFKQCV